MKLDRLQKQLKSIEERLKKAKCNKCAERLLNKALIIKKQINVLTGKN